MDTDSDKDTNASLSIYKAARTIKRRENTLYNALLSIYEDSNFIHEIAQLWPKLPLLANLRCGLWYSPKFDATCYFKSTDGHAYNLSFNITRLNLHVAQIAGQKGGCIIVDATRSGKRFPDSMSKTIPIWSCIMNRSIIYLLNNKCASGHKIQGDNWTTDDSSYTRSASHNWDCSLHLPSWVSETEKDAIEEHLEEWTKLLGASGADIASVAACLKKPLRPLWISQKTVIWLNEVPDHNSWDFTPIILVSASSITEAHRNKIDSKFSWHYIPGAGDDEESWARGLSPNLFWSHADDIINSGPDICNRKVANVVEKDSQRRRNDPLSPSSLIMIRNNHFQMFSDKDSMPFWIGSTNLVVATTQYAASMANVDCILNCDKASASICLPDSVAYLHLPTVCSKADRFSLLNNLPAAVNFAKINLNKERNILVCCHNGEDISICVCLAILVTLFNDEGTFDNAESYGGRASCITKQEMRQRLVFICNFVAGSRPSRGNLKQVYAFLTKAKIRPA